MMDADDMMDPNGMMNMDAMVGMGVMMFVGLLLTAIVIGLAVYVAVRAALRRHKNEPTPLEALQHRLAAGDISAEEYYDRESALRNSPASSPSR